MLRENIPTAFPCLHLIFIHPSSHNWTQLRSFTWVNVKLAFHRLGDALQLDRLQGAVGLDHGGQASQRLPDEPGHVPHGEELQQLAVDRRERPQEHRLGRGRRGTLGYERATSITTIITQPQDLYANNRLKRGFRRSAHTDFSNKK